jgi:diguanylate cyclase (GGDEF)-like protein
MGAADCWTVLIADDDQSVHDVTKLALSDELVLGKPLRFLHAYSASEANALLATRLDIALVLLDVVMENEQAGLEVVDHARRVLGNHLVRIILRTGQAGSAPQQKIVVDYDINGYLEKGQLTGPQLFCAAYTALSTYRHLAALDAARRDLQSTQERLQALTETLALAALTDPLTGVANRRRLDESLEAEVSRAQRYGEALSLIIADLDYFKQINDEYGHEVGDTVLKSFAHIMKSTVREVDVVARLGGDEFVILLPESGSAAAEALAERIRLSQSRAAVLPVRRAITVSLGTAELRAGESAAALLRRADRALYQAKEAGRNCQMMSAAGGSSGGL